MKPEDKKILLDILKKLGIIDNKGTAQVIINVNDGGISSLYVQKRLT